jgi:hypothetical protein
MYTIMQPCCRHHDIYSRAFLSRKTRSPRHHTREVRGVMRRVGAQACFVRERFNGCAMRRPCCAERRARQNFSPPASANSRIKRS